MRYRSRGLVPIETVRVPCCGVNPERQRLENQRLGKENWRRWGPYLSARAWGTVREDYSADGTAWEHFDHDQARSRAYRWSEDGLAGICDEGQRLCFAVALWNGRDPILKERTFGLTGNQGNRGEDVKEYYFYADATPSHSYLHYLYRYPQQPFPYRQLVEENKRRSRRDHSFGLLDTGVLDANDFWDIDVCYAKRSPEEIHIQIHALNRGRETAEIHLIPTLWFRNTWSWGAGVPRPLLARAPAPAGSTWMVRARHPELGDYYLYGAQPAEALFTQNDTNSELLWKTQSETGYVKDAFHRRIVSGDRDAVDPRGRGTKFGAWSRWRLEAGQRVRVDVVLSRERKLDPFAQSETVFGWRRNEADRFYGEMLPGARPDDSRILRQALAGMIWSKQFFHYDVNRWLTGDVVPVPPGRHHARNHQWRHFRAADVMSMPDTWEYPWFAAWDTAYQCAALALVDVDFAKDQIELLLNERYLHPNGQIPAYEWDLDEVSPPVHAMAALKVFRAERVHRG